MIFDERHDEHPDQTSTVTTTAGCAPLIITPIKTELDQNLIEEIVKDKILKEIEDKTFKEIRRELPYGRFHNQPDARARDPTE